MSKNMIMVAGFPNKGKTSSLKNLDKKKTAYINCDAKRVTFREEFELTASITDIDDLIPSLKHVEGIEEVDTVIVDTINFAMEMFESQKVLKSKDTQKMWGQYAQFYKEIITFAKASSKQYVFLGHLEDIYDNKEMITRQKVPVKGSVGRRGIEADFDTIVVAEIIEDSDKPTGLRYVFRTQIDKDTKHMNIRHPFEMWQENEIFIDNDVKILLDKINEYYALGKTLTK